MFISGCAEVRTIGIDDGTQVHSAKHKEPLGAKNKAMARQATSTQNQAPDNYEALKAAIAARYPTLSRQLQKIARFALDNPNELALETVTTIAGRAEVQPSSMIRFAQAMGYDGFSTMQQVFRWNLVARAPSYRERIRGLREERGEAGEDEDSVLGDFVDDGIASLEFLRDHTSRERLAEAVEILAGAEEIYLLAQGRAFPVAFYLSYALSRLERRCHLLDGVGGLLRQQADLATPKDAVIAVSFQPYSPLVIDIVTERSEKGVPIVAITDSPLSPMALEARVAFVIKDGQQRRFRSLVAPMCLAQTLVVSLGHRMAEKNGKGDP
jgi:DNA-binding MurR/RpiR family transcriptional regulator